MSAMGFSAARAPPRRPPRQRYPAGLCLHSPCPVPDRGQGSPQGSRLRRARLTRTRPDPTRMASPQPLRIHCWSGPRSCSTAFMYSWDARADTTCIDEPLYAHHLATHPGLVRPYRAALLEAQSTDAAALTAALADPAASTPLVFHKHMAKHVCGGVSLEAGGWADAPNARHVVLVRDPAKQLLSWDAAEASGAHGENSLDETSLPQLLQVHAKLVGLCARKGLPPPVVMDADALLADAPGVLAALCAGLGVPMDPAMLSWPAGPKACDGLWAERWYHSAHASEGWPAPHAPLPKPRPMHPRLVPLLRAAIPFYEALRPLAVSATPKLTYPDPRNADLLVWVGAPGKGRLVPRELARLSPFDSAVQGGDAVWEGVRIYRGRVYKLSRHMERLFDSARAMGFDRALTHSPAEVRAAVFATLAANNMRDGAHIRLTLSRGEKTTSSMNPAFNVLGTTLIVLAEWKPVVGATTYDNSKGVSLVTAAGRRNTPHCVDSKIHHNNLINNILPKLQANLAGAADALMLDVDGFVSETNATNIFCVKRGVLLTPHADHCLPGITRETVLRIAPGLGVEAVERRVSLAEFHAADEVFTTGSMGELTPVTLIDGRVIGDGQVGPVTQKLQKAYSALPDLDEVEADVLPDW